MADLELRWSPEDFGADLVVQANDLVTGEELKTAVLLSLFLDRRAADGDALPTAAPDRRGWWADAVPVTAGDRVGSRLWLLAREKQIAATAERATKYASEALRWIVEDRVASRVEVSVDFPRTGMLGLTVEIFRPGLDPASYRFDHVWNEGDGLPMPLPEEPEPQDAVISGAGADFVTTGGGFISTT